MATHPSILKKAQNGTFARKKEDEATDLKLGMHAQFDSANCMGCIPSGHTSSSLCVRLKIPKTALLKYILI